MRLHVTFTPSGCGGLIEALWLAERNERVFCLYDNLCLGRLESVEARAAWMYQFLDENDHVEEATELESTWAEVLDPANDVIVWFGSRSANEYLGLLEVLARRGEQRVQVIDVCSAALSTQDGGLQTVACQGEVPSAQLAVMLLADCATPAARSIVEDARTLWPRLKAEDASLRLFGPDGLASVPITYFDQALIDLTPVEWTSQPRVAGQLLGTRDDARAVGYVFLLDRISALMDDGRLDSKQNPDPDRGWLIRRRAVGDISAACLT